MQLKDILAKKAEDLSTEEKAFLNEHKSELNDEQKTAFASVIEGDGGESDGGEDETKNETDEAKPDNGGEQIIASEIKGKKVVTMSAAMFDTLQRSANEGAKAFAEVEKMKLDKEVEKLVFSSSNTEGRILPKQKEAVVSFMFSLNEKQRDQFRNVLNNLPKMDSKLFTEVGDGGAVEQTKEAIAAQVKKLASEKVTASEGKVTYAQAVRQVFAEKPELKAAYDAALSTDSK